MRLHSGTIEKKGILRIQNQAPEGASVLMIQSERKVAMRKRALVIAMAAAMTASALTPAFANETASNPEVSLVQESEAQKEDRMAVLKDAGFRPGVLNHAGWFSEYLNLQYVPVSDKVQMNGDLNSYLQGYYMRNGEEKMVSSSEFVASMDTSNMIQLTCEVNPKKQGAEEILKRFMELDEMKDAGQMETVQMGEYEFLTVSGVIDGRSAAIGVSTTKDGIVLEFKASYDADENREALLKGFAVLDQEAMKKASESKADKTRTEETETVIADQADQPGQPGRSDQTAENQV